MFHAIRTRQACVCNKGVSLCTCLWRTAHGDSLLDSPLIQYWWTPFQILQKRAHFQCVFMPLKESSYLWFSARSLCMLPYAYLHVHAFTNTHTTNAHTHASIPLYNKFQHILSMRGSCYTYITSCCMQKPWAWMRGVIKMVKVWQLFVCCVTAERLTQL